MIMTEKLIVYFHILSSFLLNKGIKVNAHIRLTSVGFCFKMLIMKKIIYTHRELEKLFKSDYQIKKAILDKKIYKIEKGIYSNTQFVHPLEIIVKKYPKAVFTMDSAFYFLGLTEVIPNKMYLAVKRNSTKTSNLGIIQIFVSDKFHEIGKTQIEFDGISINIYNMERMLIELVRNKKKLAFDYYKEIISSYRRKSADLNVTNIENYAKQFDSENYILRTIQEEVF